MAHQLADQGSRHILEPQSGAGRARSEGRVICQDEKLGQDWDHSTQAVVAAPGMSGAAQGGMVVGLVGAGGTGLYR